MEESSASSVLCRLQTAGAVPASAVILAHKGRADWTDRGLLFRLTVRRGRNDHVDWVLHVGDPLWGRPFQDGGVLALVPVRWVERAEGEGLWNWPADEAELARVVAVLAQLVAAAASFVADRRDLCALLLAKGDVVRGDFVADLHAAYPDRVLRALLIARSDRQPDIVAYIANLLRAAAAEQEAGAPSSLVSQVQVRADQWSYQSGRHIDLADLLSPVEDPVVDLSGGASAPPEGAPAAPGADHRPAPPEPPEARVEDFWNRMG